MISRRNALCTWLPVSAWRTRTLNIVRLCERTSKFGIYIAFILLCVVLSILSPYFFTVKNIVNILNQVSIIGIIAVGSTIVLISGGLDLSPGAIVAVAGVMAAHFGHPGQYPIIVPITVAVATGLAFGAVNGVLTSLGKIPPFIVTLGTMTIGRGLALLACDGMQVIDLSERYISLANSEIFGIPILIILFALVFAVFQFVLTKMRFGRHIYAVGGNETASHVSGLNVNSIKIAVYMLAGALAGFGGLLLSSRTVVGSPIAGQGYELDAIAAAVIGGTSTTGGVGKLTGTIIGALMIQVISNGLDMINVPSYWQQIVKGSIIILAVFIDMRSRNKG
ncbi:MAG: ABC transporter permease [Spirochaetia bacterium]|nr:ABC transporter permease [Spirochaetia bacterium]